MLPRVRCCVSQTVERYAPGGAEILAGVGANVADRDGGTAGALGSIMNSISWVSLRTLHVPSRSSRHPRPHRSMAPAPAQLQAPAPT